MAAMHSGRPEVYRAVACLQRLTAAFQRRRTQLAQAVGLTEQQWEVLEQIATEHFMPSMFAKQRSSSPAAVSKTIRQLIDKQLVKVALSQSDRRQRNYLLTAKGKQLMSELRQQRELAIERIWLPLERGRLQAFIEFSQLLTVRLEQYTSSTEEPP